MAKYQKYAEYKESGVQWIGEIPEDWKFLRGKWKFKTLKEVNRDLQCMDRLALTMNGVIERSIDSDEGLQPAEFSGYQIFEKDDLVFKLIDLENFKTSRVGLVFKRGIMSPAYIRLRPLQGTYSRFFYYFYFDLYLRGVYNQIGGQGVRSALNATDLLEIEICVPALEEQIQIANFLDHETAKIDTLIAKQAKLIELLKEKRQAVISHAVTKGLNPNVPMKDSSVEWLEGVPEHWTVIKLKHLTTLFEQGWSPQCDSRTAEPHEYGILKVGCVNGGKFRALENKALPSELEPRLQYLIQKNDLLISRANTKELVGSAAVIDEDYPNLILCDKLYRLRFTRAVSAEMVALYLSIGVVREQIELSATGASHSMQNIGQDTIKELFYLLPPIDEAHNILKDIAESNTKFDSLISKAGSAIQLMQERRTALISTAVTGKIDVRHWQHPNQKNNNNTELSA
jgi:type I restriction enzyme S subunit